MGERPKDAEEAALRAGGRGHRRLVGPRPRRRAPRGPAARPCRLRGAEPDALEAAVAEVEDGGGQALAVELYVASEDECHRLVEQAVDAFGSIDSFVRSHMVSVYGETQELPPIYQPEPFAEVVLHCCEDPPRELPIGWGAQKALWAQKLAPRLVDRRLLRTGWESQTTGEPKSIDEPDNLFEPLPGDPGARGRFDAQARARTAWTTLRLHPMLATALALIGLGLPAQLARRAASNGHAGPLRRLTRIG